MKSLMKSLHNITNNELFTPEILDWIAAEGFEYKSNDSYCFPDECDRYENMCYYKLGGYYANDWPVRIYIFSIGIGVDVDYECGGNSSTYFWKFEDYDNSFESVYDLMVDTVARQING